MESIIRFTKIVNIIVMVLPIYFLWTYQIAKMSQIEIFFWGNVAVVGFFALLYCTCARIYDVFRLVCFASATTEGVKSNLPNYDGVAG